MTIAFSKEASVKKVTFILVTLLVLGSFTMASAFDLKGMMGIGAFVDYGFGFGDNFDDVDLGSGTTGETSLGFSFGAQFMYGLTDKIALAAVWDYVQIKFDVTGEEAEYYDDIDNESYMKFAANAMYFFNTEATLCPFVLVGPAFFVPSAEGADSKFGFNGGVGALYFMQENMAIEFGGTFNYVMDKDEDIGIDANTTYAEIFVGFKYFFGGME